MEELIDHIHYWIIVHLQLTFLQFRRTSSNFSTKLPRNKQIFRMTNQISPRKIYVKTENVEIFLVLEFWPLTSLFLFWNPWIYFKHFAFRKWNLFVFPSKSNASSFFLQNLSWAFLRFSHLWIFLFVNY